jgi:hypothetical protein
MDKNRNGSNTDDILKIIEEYKQKNSSEKISAETKE